MCGNVLGQQFTVLKDDCCNANVMSHSFVNKHKEYLNIRKTSFLINHSNKDSVEEATEIVVDTEIQIVYHRYKSNWFVADCRYDILLVMPWHVSCSPKVKYNSGTLKTGGVPLPSSRYATRTIPVQNIGVKKFRSLLRKKKRHSPDFVVYQLRSLNNFSMKTKDNVLNEYVDEDEARIRE